MKHRKKRLLYIMSVDWNWIAQRPHFMALELARKMYRCSADPAAGELSVSSEAEYTYF